MKSLIINYLSILLCAQAFFACAPDVKKTPERTFRIIHNNDGPDLLGNRWFKYRPLTLADLDSCVDMVANSQVTTYMMCSGSDFFYVRSKYGHVMGDDLNGTLDCGCDTAQYNSFRKYYRNHLNLEKEGTDLVAYTLKRAKEKGMEAFITYRMNDLHFNDTTTHCPIWYTENYADIIDGDDLDFMRFIVYFKSGTGPQNAPLMTQLVKDIRQKVDEISAKQGRKILLSARVAPTVEQNMMKGLDIREWLRLGLLDFISTGVHWRGDPAMPVAKFREEMGKELNIPFYSSIDDGGYRPREFWSHGMHRGMCSHILSQGADGIYLFNYYFGTLNTEHDGKLYLEDGGQVCRVMMPELLQELGSLETLKGRNKIYALSDGVVQYNIKPDSPLPLKIGKGEEKEVDLYIGDSVEEGYPEEAILFIRTSRPASCRLTVNGKAVEKEMPAYTHLYDRERGLEKEEKEYAFIPPDEVLKQGYNRIGFQSEDNDTFTVKRVEIALKYGDVETHGYF